jgi:hypothetical protein
MAWPSINPQAFWMQIPKRSTVTTWNVINLTNVSTRTSHLMVHSTLAWRANPRQSSREMRARGWSSSSCTSGTVEQASAAL